MVQVEISDEVYGMIRSFRKVIDSVIGEELDGIDDYVEFILRIGTQKMLQDVLPDEEELQRTMIAMFRDNPEYVSDFISRVIRESREDKKSGAREEWTVAYR